MINASPNPEGTCTLVMAKIFNRFQNKRNVKRFTLNTMNIHGCQECFSCKTSQTDTCYFMDDMPILLEAIKKTDYLIIASPVVFSDVNSQLKSVIDRTLSFFGIDGTASHLPRGRKLLFVLSHELSDRDQCQRIVERYTPYFRIYGFESVELMAIDSEHHARASQDSADIERMLDERFPLEQGRIIKSVDIDLLENR